MRLSGLRIQNFKAIGQHRFELTGLNIFLGKNGMGKSSTIQSLLLIKDNIKIDIIEKLKESQKPFIGSLNLKTRYYDLGFSNDIYKINESEERIKFLLETSKGNLLINSQFKSGSDYLFTEIRGVDLTEEPDLWRFGFQYLSANRISPNDLFALSTRDVERNYQLGNLGENTPHFLLRFGDDPAFRVDPPMLHLNQDIPSNLIYQVSAFLSDLGSPIRVKVTPIADRVQLKYDVFRSDGLTDTFKPQHVGFGLTYSLPVVTSLLAGKPGKVQIIENPESHLHPMGQAQMGKLLAKAANAGQQLFIETHSDHIINGVRVAVKEGLLDPNEVILHFFDKPKGQRDVVIIPIRIDKNGNLSDYPDGFLDEWDNQLLKLL